MPPHLLLTRLPGIDVSHWQGDINWDAVFQSGVVFALMKASEGQTYKDPRFDFNWFEARRVGIKRSAYHYFRTNRSVQAQIDNFVRVVQELQPGDMPPVLDVEEPAQWAGIPVSIRVDMIIEWIEGVRARLGITPQIYTSPSFVGEVLGNDPRLAPYLLWIAHWTSRNDPWVPSPWSNWTFWQHSSTGRIDGINGNVDLDRFNGGLEDLLRICVQPPAPCFGPRFATRWRKFRFRKLLAGELPARWLKNTNGDTNANLVEEGTGFAGGSFRP